LSSFWFRWAITGSWEPLVIYYLIKFHILKWNHQIVRYSHCMIDFGNNSYKCFFCHVISDSKDCVQSNIDVIAMILFSLFCHIFICMNGGLLIKILCTSNNNNNNNFIDFKSKHWTIIITTYTTKQNWNGEMMGS
jgi:hypothetical protein